MFARSTKPGREHESQTVRFHKKMLKAHQQRKDIMRDLGLAHENGWQGVDVSRLRDLPINVSIDPTSRALIHEKPRRTARRLSQNPGDLVMTTQDMTSLSDVLDCFSYFSGVGLKSVPHSEDADVWLRVLSDVPASLLHLAADEWIRTPVKDKGGTLRGQRWSPTAGEPGAQPCLFARSRSPRSGDIEETRLCKLRRGD